VKREAALTYVKQSLPKAAANGSNRIAHRCARWPGIKALTCVNDLYRPACH
jgi:hypothetical protein